MKSLTLAVCIFLAGVACMAADNDGNRLVAKERRQHDLRRS